MGKHDEKEEDKDQILNLHHSFLPALRAGLHQQIDGIECLLEVKESDQLEVLACDGLVEQNGGDTPDKAD